jgi:hypothetical protein
LGTLCSLQNSKFGHNRTEIAGAVLTGKVVKHQVYGAQTGKNNIAKKVKTAEQLQSKSRANRPFLHQKDAKMFCFVHVASFFCEDSY